MPPITNDWLPKLQPEFDKDYYKNLYSFIVEEYKTKTIFPPGDDIFNAFHLTPLKDVKVVIIGQDPYHGMGEAHGLCFSVKPGIKIPPSLKNIYAELNTDLGCSIPNNGFLEKWAKQGVLMINSVLTVRSGVPASHKNMGWEEFTNAVIRIVNEEDRPIVFLLWGNFAKEKKSMLTNPKHLILEAAHPSPFSARNGFFGCKHFSKTNEFLKENGLEPIDWQIENI